MASPAHQQVQRLLNTAVNNPAELVDMDVEDLDLLFRVSRRTKLTGRLAYGLERLGLVEKLPQIASNMLSSARALADARRRLALWELNRIAWALGDAGDFPLVVAKGCAYLLLNLPNAPGRIFSDVDLILEKTDLQNVEAILQRRGWRSTRLSPYDDRYYRKWTHELPPLIHAEREVEVDLHHNILPGTARPKPPAEELLRGVRKFASGRFSVMCNEHVVLHAMSHLMYSDDMADKLRELVDIHELLAIFSKDNADFWTTFVDRADKLDLGRAAYYSARYARVLLSANVPEIAIARLDRWKPNIVVLWAMDRLVPQAIYPPHPDHPSRYNSLCRLALYIRSHWVRMPPWLLAYHLVHKSLARMTSRQEPARQTRN